jgi:hypothetical protein
MLQSISCALTRHSHDLMKPGADKADDRHALRRWIVPIILGIGAIAAWIFPGTKPNAVLGRLNYLQFWIAMGLSLGCLTGVVVALAPAATRRITAFKAAAIWLGLGAALLLTELTAYILPVRHQMDNPWFVWAGGGMSAEADLPFGRPPHLKWTGSSRGDLAILNDDEDPYAETITFQTDRDGFRNSEEISEADLITIGDSYTEAGNLPEMDNYTVLLGRRLGLKSRNLGRAGYTTPTELTVLKKYGLKCHPKIVIWQLTESNDLKEAADYNEWIAKGRPPYSDLLKQGRKSRADIWPQRSPTHLFFSFFRNHDPRPWPYNSGVFKDDRGDEHPIRFLWESALNEPARGHSGWNTFSASLNEGAELCRTNGIRLLVVLVPMKYRVLGPYIAQPEGTYDWVSRAPGFSEKVAIGPLLQSFCAGHDIPFVDATTALQKKAAAGGLVYLPFDTHLSRLGHQVLTDLILENLKPAEAAQPAK